MPFGLVRTTCADCATVNEFEINDTQREYRCKSCDVLLVKNTKAKESE
jgi:phage FluMu protein Com